LATPEHRISPRFQLHAPMSFARTHTVSDDEYKASTINISIRGVYFATQVILQVGESVEILLGMPKRVAGVKAGIRRFLGRVTHIEPMYALPGLSGIGVHLLYFERVIGAHPRASSSFDGLTASGG
jgi:hypothetical protein